MSENKGLDNLGRDIDDYAPATQPDAKAQADATANERAVGEHCKQAAEEVATWPAWKQGALRGSREQEANERAVEEAQYPECEKWAAALDDGGRRVIEFIEWLYENGYRIAEHNCWNHLHEVHRTENKWLAEFAGIDEKKLEDERRAMLEACRRE